MKEIKATNRVIHIPEKSSNHDVVFKELIDIVGEEYVRDDLGTNYVYSKNMTEFEQYLPEYVVAPGSTEEVSEIIKLANEHKVPIQCQVKGLNMGDCHMLLDGGLLIDLRRMSSVLDVDEDSSYALCEAGVSFADLRKELRENHPDFIVNYGFMPASCGIVANALVEGHLQYSNKYGCSYHNLLSAEVVLPTGEIVKVGARGLVNSWNRRSATPDLLGLFSGGWYGTTGIVTKAAIRIIPKPKFSETVFVTTPNIKSACEMPRRLAASHLCDGIGSVDWRMCMLVGGSKKAEDVPNERPEGWPETSMDVSFSSYVSEEEFELKRKNIESIAEELDGEVLPLDGFGYETERFCSLPMVEGAPGGVGPFFAGAGKGSGLSWIGGLGEDKYYEDLYEGTLEIFDKYPDIFPQICMYEMSHGHVGCFREIVSFDRADPDQVNQVRNAHKEVVKMMYDHGYTLYKAPKFATDILMKDYADSEFLNLMKKVRKTLDPSGIMAPKRWNLSDDDDVYKYYGGSEPDLDTKEGGE